jgi:TonB family protein
MADTNHPPERPRYDPLTSDRAPNRGGPTRWIVASVVSLAVYFGILYPLYKAKFETKIDDFSDTAVKVNLLKPPPPAPPPPPAHAAVISNPDWIRIPSGDDVNRYYPDRATRFNMAGSAKMSCVVTASGTLSDCSVVSETPEGYGFGDAALKMAKLFKMKPSTRDGQAVGGASVTVPLKFVLPTDE